MKSGAWCRLRREELAPGWGSNVSTQPVRPRLRAQADKALQHGLVSAMDAGQKLPTVSANRSRNRIGTPWVISMKRRE